MSWVKAQLLKLLKDEQVREFIAELVRDQIQKFVEKKLRVGADRDGIVLHEEPSR